MSDFFLQNILTVLEKYFSAGELKNEMGTRLIGHCPHIAPKAYMHVIYAPLSEEELQEFRDRIGSPVNDQLDNFYRFVNGMMIYSGQLRILGYVPLKRKSDTRIYNYPPNIIVPNVSARIKGLGVNEIIIGFYQVDGSYALIQDNGCVVRFNPKDNGSFIQKWPSFENWLFSEIKRLDSEQHIKVH